MFSVEEVSSKISNSITKELELDENKRAVVNYGIFAIMHTALSVGFVIVFGALFNVLIEALVITLTISILRKSAGGAHASSPGICAFVGTVLSVGMSLVIKNINLSINVVIIISIFIFIWSYWVVYKLAPVDSPSKPIRTDAKRKRLKKSSILILSVYLVIIVGNITGYYATQNVDLLVYSGCIHIGLLWQIFSLTQKGHIVLEKLDALFK